MKIQYKLGLMAIGVLAMTSCEKHDPFDDHGAPGQVVPTVYWELGSTACKAGDAFNFSGKYWTEEGYTVDHSEVWYSVVRTQESTASAKLAGSLMSFTKAVGEVDTVRTMLKVAEYPHSQAEWDGYEFVLTGSVPTSSTLSPLRWAPADKWDELAQTRFNSYFPEKFAEEFNAEVVALIMKESSYSALRKVFCDYPFTNEQVAAVNATYGVELPLLTDEVLAGDAQAAVTFKSDAWYATTEADAKAIIAYYHTTIDAEGNAVANMVDKADVTIDENGNPVYNVDATIKLYPVYDSAPWVFCRYDDDKGAILSTVKAEYLPAFTDLMKLIKFEEWVYSATDGYAVAFNRKYDLKAQFKVFDNAGNVGVAYDTHSVQIN